MNWDAVAKVLVAIGGAVAALQRIVSERRTRSHRRDQIKGDIELLHLLPKDSASRTRLEKHIEQSVFRLVDDGEEKRRDPMGIVLGILMVAGAAWAASFPIRFGGSSLWWVLALPLGTLGLVGLAQDGVRRRRDDRGRPIKGDGTTTRD